MTVVSSAFAVLHFASQLNFITGGRKYAEALNGERMALTLNYRFRAIGRAANSRALVLV
jgi:hypothetical protein